MTRRIPIAALALAALAVPVTAQTVAFRAPVRLAAESSSPPYSYFYALARYSTPVAPDLFVGLAAAGTNPARADWFPHGTPLASGSFPFPALPPGSTTCFAAGNWANGDALADLAWCDGGIWFDLSPGGAANGITTGDVPSGLLFAHLLDAPGDVLVAGFTTALHTLVLASSTPAVPSSYFPLDGPDLGYPTAPGGPASTFALQRTRLGPVARGVAQGSAGKGLDDLVWSRTGLASVFVVWTTAVLPDFASLAAYDAFPGAQVSFPGALEVHGAGALDVDGDGTPDLVAAVANATGPGSLVAVRNDGVLADLPSGTRTDLTATLGLVDPALAEPLEVDGVPAVAVWDRAQALIVVATRDPARGLVTWIGPTDPARSVRRILAGDVTGCAVADLVVGYADGAIDVFAGAPPPLVTLVQGGGTAPVRLVPGGTRFSVEATAVDTCGSPIAFQWSAAGLPPGASTSLASAGASSRLDVFVPEADYPALVARIDRTAAFTVTASNGASSSPASIEVVDFDASGLVAVSQVTDRTSLAPGELAFLTTTLSSAIGVDLAEVRLDTAVQGLEPAGPVRVVGAVLLAQGSAAGGPSFTLDRIPGGGAPVAVELAVRRKLGGGGASGAQARSAVSGAALSPAVDATPPRATPPGLSCGQSGSSPLALLAVWLYMKAMRRVPARTRSTSSSTPMRRQA